MRWKDLSLVPSLLREPKDAVQVDSSVPRGLRAHRPFAAPAQQSQRHGNRSRRSHLGGSQGPSALGPQEAPGGPAALSSHPLSGATHPNALLCPTPASRASSAPSLTLKLATASPPSSSRKAQQRAFDRFRLEYNEQRPHEALGQRLPTDFSYWGRDFDYPAEYERSRVRSSGRSVFVSATLKHQWLGLQWQTNGSWLPMSLLPHKSQGGQPYSAPRQRWQANLAQKAASGDEAADREHRQHAPAQ